MRRVLYGSKWIEYSFQQKEGLKSHYISVERYLGVVLKGKAIESEKADQLVLKKASWILSKLEVVGSDTVDTIVTGSRIPYLGKSYYTEVIVDAKTTDVDVVFNYSKFKIHINNPKVDQQQILKALEHFYKIKAVEKIEPRVENIASKLKLPYKDVAIRKMHKRWGSCTANNRIILNSDAVQLPFTLIDYLIIHELCHTKVKDHSKAFWRELALHVPNWKELDEKVKAIKVLS